MPILPRKINTIVNAGIKWWHAPCSTPPLIFAVSAVEASLMLGWTLLSPDPKEVIHAASGKSVLCHIKTGANAVHEEHPLFSSQGKRFLWKFAEGFDIGLWLMFLYYSVEDALYMFTTSVIKNSVCDHKNMISFRQGTWAVGGRAGGPDYLGGLRWYTADGSSFADSGIFIPPGCHGFVGGSSTWTTLSGIPVPTQMRIIVKETGEILDTNISKDGVFSMDGRTVGFAQYSNQSGAGRTIEMQWAFPTQVGSFARTVAQPWGAGCCGVFRGTA